MDKKLLLVPILKYNELDELFKCGVCRLPLFRAPVYTCKSLKSICGSCVTGFYHSCKNDLKHEDDDVLEQRLYLELASLASFPCCFSPCETMVKGEYQSIDHFIKHCEFKKIRCPFSEYNRSFLDSLDEICDWKGSTDEEMVRHIQEAHDKYVLQDNPPRVDLCSLQGNPSMPRRLYIIINKSDLISLIFIERLGLGFVLDFRQNRISEKIDACFYQLKPSGKEGLRKWSYLLNATMFSNLNNSYSTRLVWSDVSRFIAFHIEKACGIPENPKFFLTPNNENWYESIKARLYVTPALGKRPDEPKSDGETAKSENVQTESIKSKNKTGKTTKKDPKDSMYEMEESGFEIVNEIPKTKIRNVSNDKTKETANSGIGQKIEEDIKKISRKNYH